MKDFLFFIGFSTLLLTLWIIDYKDREYCDKKQGYTWNTNWINECIKINP